MKRASIIKRRYAGVLASGIFSVWILLSEYSTIIIGGDLGSFSYVSFHFILNPKFGITIIVFEVWHSFIIDGIILKIANIAACTVPVYIIYTGMTGSLWLSELLGIKFQ